MKEQIQNLPPGLEFLLVDDKGTIFVRSPAPDRAEEQAGAGAAFVGMSAACATTLTLIATSATFARNKFFMGTLARYRHNFPLPRNSNTISAFWLLLARHSTR